MGARRALPYVLLAVVLFVSTASRTFRLDQPCDESCAAGGPSSLIFDEAYYVNAARRIAGRPTAADPAGYGAAPAHTDPNAEHPQLAKLVMAAGIVLIGDRALGYRMGSVAAGTAALALLFGVVRAAGGSPWTAVAATAVLAVDNLFLVHGRIATLDIYVLAFVLGGVLLYLRERPLLAGLVLGVGATTKVVGIYALFILGLLETGRWLVRKHRPGAIESLAACIVATLASYGVALEILDLAVPAYAGHRIGDAAAHTRYMLDYARDLTTGGHAGGIVSAPWSWLIGRGEIPYLTVATPGHAPQVAFRGAVNPFLLYATAPALAVAAWRAWRRGEDVDLLALAWFAGTMGPFALQAGFQHRITYLYYMLLALPGICIAAVRLFSRGGLVRVAAVAWGVGLVIGAIDLFPFRTLL
ncbi:MAG TPA: phospholipid carrier-dependent glycosyltransferase [Solirubrobacteraceae bacterium]|jgi:predicted membrane-bound dolichyl-phosphate-mannose-protein mannosyltransferase